MVAEGKILRFFCGTRCLHKLGSNFGKKTRVATRLTEIPTNVISRAKTKINPDRESLRSLLECLDWGQNWFFFPFNSKGFKRKRGRKNKTRPTAFCCNLAALTLYLYFGRDDVHVVILLAGVKISTPMVSNERE